MSLHLRILLGYGYLVALVVLSSAGAVLGFLRLSNQLEQVLSDSSESVRAATTMLEVLDRQDAAVRELLLDPSAGRRVLDSTQVTFERALEHAGGNVAGVGEPEMVQEIHDRFVAYRNARDELLAAPSERPLAAYEASVFPRYQEAKGRVFALLELNTLAMVKADEGTHKEARRRALLHGILVTIALLSLGFMSRELRRLLLDRLAELKEVAEAIAAGDRRRRATPGRDDELGLVARQLNAALDTQEATENEMAGRLAHERQLLLGLLAAQDHPAAVLALSGKLIAANLPTADLTPVEDAGTELRDHEHQPITLPAGNRKVTCRPLVTPGNRPVGWLASVENGANKTNDKPRKRQPTPRKPKPPPNTPKG